MRIRSGKGALLEVEAYGGLTKEQVDLITTFLGGEQVTDITQIERDQVLLEIPSRSEAEEQTPGVAHGVIIKSVARKSSRKGEVETREVTFGYATASNSNLIFSISGKAIDNKTNTLIKLPNWLGSLIDMLVQWYPGIHWSQN